MPQKFKYVGPIDSIEVAGQIVLRNHQFEVSDEVAGRPASPRYFEIVDELVAAVGDHVRTVALKAEFEKVDIGAGLLAQPENFQPVSTGKAKEADK